MSFRFRLDKVLRHRSRLVDEQKRRVQEAVASLASVRRGRRTLEAEITDLLRRSERSRASGVGLPLWSLQSTFLGVRRAEAEALAAKEREAGAELERRRQDLLAAERDREVLVKLAERQEQQWRLEQARNDRKILDEIAAVRVARHAGPELP